MTSAGVWCNADVNCNESDYNDEDAIYQNEICYHCKQEGPEPVAYESGVKCSRKVECLSSSEDYRKCSTKVLVLTYSYGNDD